MSVQITRLGPGDESVLTLLAREDADFDLDGRASERRPLDSVAARRYLADPAVLHWIAREDGIVVGFLYCLVVPLRSGAGRELLLYEIGVRHTHRRRGVGRSLLVKMEEWMQQSQIANVWVLAENPDATDFYRACGFAVEHTQPMYLVRRLSEKETEPNQPAEPTALAPTAIESRARKLPLAARLAHG